MTVNEIKNKLNMEALNIPEPDKVIDGVYAGDLLSWIMGRAEPGNIWVTIMTNINVLAVASLLDLSAVIIAEGSEYSDDFIKTAAEKGINILKTNDPIYKTCVELSRLLG